MSKDNSHKAEAQCEQQCPRDQWEEEEFHKANVAMGSCCCSKWREESAIGNWLFSSQRTVREDSQAHSHPPSKDKCDRATWGIHIDSSLTAHMLRLSHHLFFVLALAKSCTHQLVTGVWGEVSEQRNIRCRPPQIYVEFSRVVSIHKTTPMFTVW